MIEVVLKSRIPDIIEHHVAAVENAVGMAAGNMSDQASFHSRVRYGYMREGWDWDFIDWNDAEVYDLIDVNEITKGRQYAVFNEYGTRFMSAQPMIWPALYETIPVFERELAKIFDPD